MDNPLLLESSYSFIIQKRPCSSHWSFLKDLSKWVHICIESSFYCTGLAFLIYALQIFYGSKTSLCIKTICCYQTLQILQPSFLYRLSLQAEDI